MNSNKEKQTICLKCGTCCRKNGPVLHIQDKQLILEKILTPENMVVLRAGEPAMDNISGKPVLLKGEIIKVRGKKAGSWSCVFHDHETNLCSIHSNRPKQCRLLECWNPEEMVKTYKQDLLTRAHLLKKGSALEEITTLHENKCSVGELVQLIKDDLNHKAGSKQKINDMISYDEAFRKTFQEKTKIDPKALDYYLGRSLKEIINPIIKFLE
ncbi:MAG: YkgJ family cysteine cluster protein, partial [Desulfonatronovibrio sp.]